MLSQADFIEWDEVFRKQVIMRLDSLMIGVCAAYFFNYHTLIWEKNKKIGFILGITIIVIQKIYSLSHEFELNQYNYIYSFLLYPIAFALLLPALNNKKTGAGIIYNVLSRISIISYSMYLLNLSIVQIAIVENINWFQLTGTSLIFTKYIIYWILTIAESILLYKYYELPFMKLRDKL